MSDEKNITYNDIVTVINHLHYEGRKVTLEYVRRNLGRGTHAQIALFLSRWKKENGAATNHNNTRTGSAELSSSDVIKTNTPLHKSSTNTVKRTKKQPRHYQQPSYNRNEYKKICSSKKALFKTVCKLSKSDSFTCCEPLTIERLQLESDIVQKLLRSIAIVKKARRLEQDQHQILQKELVNYCLKYQHKGLELQKYANKRIMALKKELNRLKISYDREITSIRYQLSI